MEKKEPDEQKSATPGGDFPLPFFLLEPVSFFSPNMSDWNVSYRKGYRFGCMANSPTKCCLREQTESAVWDSSQALIRNLRQRRSNFFSDSHNSKGPEYKRKKVPEDDDESHIDLPKIVQGIHVGEEDSPVLEPKMKRRCNGERLWRRG